MTNSSLNVTRTNILLTPDPSRVLLRPFTPGDSARIEDIFARILALDEDLIPSLLDEVVAEFSWRHRNIRDLFLQRFQQVAGGNSKICADISEKRRMLAGAYFLAEYSVESAALFNPSLVPHPDQTELPPGALRFLLSLRATGEGHISSITFRTGIIHPDNRIEVVTPTGLLTEPQQIPNSLYERPLFERKIQELGLLSDFTRRITGRLKESFCLPDLRTAIDAELAKEGLVNGVLVEDQNAAHAIWALALSNYEVQFLPHQELSERILFPATPSQRNGIEDARFVHFRHDDGTFAYYATFTAFDGRAVMPELVETVDFLHFRFVTLNGPAARNKGMALFPRKIGGRFAMLSRQDNESIYLMFSDNIHFWNECKLLLRPRFPWELVQLGNCGSPIETDAGWLVLSHGVGPMRKYSIGAFLLDHDDPTKVIGRLREPLLQPNQSEREGYVPNVVYTCGAIIHNKQLIIPYGLADRATSFASVPVAEVLAAMEPDE
jgi:predicted GH43/DUF377 family glycosyl hydrolase